MLAGPGEVANEALLIFRATLIRRRDLGFDFARGAKAFAPFLRTIMRRDCQRAIRSMARPYQPGREIGEIDFVTEDVALVDPAPEGQPLQAALLAEEHSLVLWAMQRLSPRERESLLMHAAGHKLAAVAKRTNVSVATAQRVVQRALCRVRQIMGRHSEATTLPLARSA